MYPALIAICGSKRSGKDTIANYLVEKHGYQNIKIAENLKTIVKELFNFTNDQVGESDDKDVIDKTWNITPRQALQFLGTEVMQYKIQELLPHIGRKFWINSLIKSLDPNKKYVVSDMRFVHEYEELAKLNVYVIKVFRPAIVQEDTHSSETEYKTIPENLCIINDTTIPDMLIKLNDTLSCK